MVWKYDKCAHSWRHEAVAGSAGLLTTSKVWLHCVSTSLLLLLSGDGIQRKKRDSGLILCVLLKPPGYHITQGAPVTTSTVTPICTVVCSLSIYIFEQTMG